jgi:hypothetical protein
MSYKKVQLDLKNDRIDREAVAFDAVNNDWVEAKPLGIADVAVSDLKVGMTILHGITPVKITDIRPAVRKGKTMIEGVTPLGDLFTTFATPRSLYFIPLIPIPTPEDPPSV